MTDDATPPVDLGDLPRLDRTMCLVMQMLRVLFRLAAEAPETVTTVARAKAALRSHCVVFVGKPGPFGLMDDLGQTRKARAFRERLAKAEGLALGLFFEVRHANHCGIQECCGPAPLLETSYEQAWVQTAREGRLAEPYVEQPQAEYRHRYRKKGADGPTMIVSRISSECIEYDNGDFEWVHPVTLLPERGNKPVTILETELLAEWDRVMPNARERQVTRAEKRCAANLAGERE